MIKTNWSLDELVPSMDVKLLDEQLSSMKEDIKKIVTFTKVEFKSNTNTVEKLEKYISLMTDYGKYEKIDIFLYLTLATNSSDSIALKYTDKFQSISQDLVEANVNFKTFISKIENIDEIINESNVLKQHKYFLLENKKMSKYMLTKEEEYLIGKLSLSGSNSWEKLRGQLISNLTIPVHLDGEEKILTFPAVRNLAYHSSKKVRKEAYEAEINSYKNIDTSVSMALNSIKAETITINQKRGLTPLENTLIHSRMDKEVLDAMISSIVEYLPTLRKYFTHKAKKLGYEKGLPFYELFAPLGKVEMNFTYDEAIEYIIKSLCNFDSSLGDYVKKAVNNNWIDALPKEGKSDGAFCCNIHTIGESRILSNFSGTYSCMSTLAHELGHGYHGECLKNEKYLNSDYPMPIAETASIFFETLVSEESLQNANDDEKLYLLNNSLTEATQVLVDIYSRFLFESELIKKREDGPLSVEELCDLMVWSQKQSYGDGLCEYHPYMWLCKPHYYSSNFYNFPYAFGMLFAKGLYAYSKKTNNKKFLEEYNMLLKETGKNDLYDLGIKFGINIKDKEFWKASLESIKEEIELFLSL